MKLFLILYGLLLFSIPVIGQKHSRTASVIFATLHDSTIRKTINEAMQTHATLFKVSVRDTVLWYSGGDIHPSGFENHIPGKKVHYIDVTKMRITKPGHLKLKAVLDNKVKIRANTWEQRKDHWVVTNCCVHTKGWLLKKGGYYYFSTIPTCNCD